MPSSAPRSVPLRWLFVREFSLLLLALVAALACPISETAGAGRNEARSNRAKPAEPVSVEALVAKIKPAVVVITHFDRDGKEDGVGAGFVVSSNGLIATSLHVIGEGRPFKVQFPDGTTREATEITGWDRTLDLAVFRVNATNLPALPLGDSDDLRQGATVLAIGNPLGLKHSVVEGVVSARRDFNGVEMIQLAIPVEPGNSGGPLLDLQGNVYGLLTMKSAMTANLGFATPINELKPMLKHLHPVSLEHWVRWSALDTNDWRVLFGAHWTQKSGRISADTPGSGFGGRSLCLSTRKVPLSSYELSVTVRLDDESGAAGLVFGSDGHDKHYGFYPSGGQLRLTRFDGPDVFSWTILEQVPSPVYVAGDWNTLKVHHEPGHIRCYVNGQLVIESHDKGLPFGSVGLAKFRDTRASFKGFRIAAPASELELSAPVASLLTNILQHPERAKADELGELPESERLVVQNILHEKAGQMEQRAIQLRRTAAELRRAAIQRELLATLRGPEPKIDLFRATLLISKLDNPDLDIEAYERQLERMAAEAKMKVRTASGKSARLNEFIRYFFVENGFHGSRTDYYNRANSYLDQVMDEREGLPITLSVLFIELGHRIGISDLYGALLPGHFMVRYLPSTDEEQLIDVFDEGTTVTREQAEELVRENSGGSLREEYLKPALKRDIVLRMLHNLHSAAQGDSSQDSLRYLDVILAIAPESAADHLDRARLRIQAGDRTGAREDLKWLLDATPPGMDMERVSELLNAL